MKGMYTAKDFEPLFTTSAEDQDLDDLWHKWVAGYRTRTITSGSVREIIGYPIWKTQKQAIEAKGKMSSAGTREVQRKLNQRNSWRKLDRKANANFTTEDITITLTYKGEAPTYERAQKDMTNYLNRIKRWRKRNGLPELKYIYVIEYAEDGESRRVHQHVIMSGMDRDEAERIWNKGRANCRRLQPDENGLAGLAKYMTKDPKGRKRWNCSTNLVKYTSQTTSDSKISRRKVERMMLDLNHQAKEVLEALNPGYKLMDCEIKLSDFVAGAYIYARMYKEQERGKVGATRGSGCKSAGGQYRGVGKKTKEKRE